MHTLVHFEILSVCSVFAQDRWLAAESEISTPNLHECIWCLISLDGALRVLTAKKHEQSNSKKDFEFIGSNIADGGMVRLLNNCTAQQLYSSAVEHSAYIKYML